MCFNPRVLAGGRDLVVPYDTDNAGVSIHASSREDATWIPLLPFLFLPGFNPRVLAGGRDSFTISSHSGNKVSLHASSREDATYLLQLRQPLCRFQSTRPRGRTRLFLLTRKAPESGFNPRVLAGGRDPENNARSGVSGFNPRVLAGGRDSVTVVQGQLKKFQSTRPRGRTRRHCSFLREPSTSFNPRVLAGGRDMIAPNLNQIVEFQSTRPRGRTRQNFLDALTHATSFNPRVLAGGRDILFRAFLMGIKFQSTRPRGRTRQLDSSFQGGRGVSIHASSREDATR